MRREDLGDLASFLAVAEERSFTRAAARLGTSQSSLSQVVRRLEERLGVRLLTRTTRSVAPTEAGLQLAETLRPAFGDIEARLQMLNELRNKPAGTLRITSGRHAAEALLYPVVKRLIAEYPDLSIEISADQRLVDLVGDRFDAGIRLGESVEKDMVAVRISPDVRMVVVGSPAYLERNGTPKTPYDLTGHNCINLRMPTSGGLYVWEFEKDGHPLNVRVDGNFVSDDAEIVLKAAVDGVGLACLPDFRFTESVATGGLVEVLSDWCPPFPGYHIYYPSRRQMTPALRLLIDALRSHR